MLMICKFFSCIFSPFLQSAMTSGYERYINKVIIIITIIIIIIIIIITIIIIIIIIIFVPKIERNFGPGL